MEQSEQSGRGGEVHDNIRIAAYMRLSKASGIISDEREKERGESNSIAMQRILIRQYVASHFVRYQIVEYQDM